MSSESIAAIASRCRESMSNIRHMQVFADGKSYVFEGNNNVKDNTLKTTLMQSLISVQRLYLNNYDPVIKMSGHITIVSPNQMGKAVAKYMDEMGWLLRG
ncbi:MAG: hypothetical protein KGH61_04605 [Candidatus Micrarchaeota archaeon]|nr:hypothetical protein [Candidatus Micrarchaeota archaeon]MDE1848198.1 hypothetical protein [Candidatus Micrarchaeota archaeon]MDE1864846.1 hypothetical protein [Candidatus Micrarchaeota archaeon]